MRERWARRSINLFAPISLFTSHAHLGLPASKGHQLKLPASFNALSFGGGHMR